MVMLLSTPHVLSSIPRLLLIPLVLLLTGLFILPRPYHEATTSTILPHLSLSRKNVTEAASTFSPATHGFWRELATALVVAQPQCDSLALGNGTGALNFPDPRWEPLNTHNKPIERLYNFTEYHERALLRAHYSMRTAAKHLGPKLPFAAGTTGIVMTSNKQYMPICLVSLRMLRRTGNKMPVEIFIDDWSKYDPVVCETVLPSLNARCVIMSNIFNSAHNVAPLQHFQFKIFALLFSSFQHVLFLDSDSFPAYDPSVLFTTAPYTTHGLVTWPDFWALSISSHFYHIAGIPEEKFDARLSTESGQVLINKDIHRDSLLMMVYYNYYGPDFYYILLSQGAPGAGDKETFVQAAMAVGLPYYQVKTGPHSLGRHIKGEFRGIGISQADPGVDFEYLPPMKSHLHANGIWEDADLAHPDPAVAKALNHTRKAPAPPRRLFLHQNILKLNPAVVLNDKNMPTYEPDGTPHRMWGNVKEDMIHMVGYDVERRLWDVIAEEGCRDQQDSKICAKLRTHIGEVFGWMDSIDRPW
ncbi:hypothetical protein IAQ61_011200 [Plenodomus lingam]|uniref:Alpha-1,2-mannosyltransferase n=1 Tax=Leptosphaeria maculans (strain JN3 / isolate v23.1.3 / race Av1-4-5-6-7-8) TaxID=985895 RepID=E5A9C5_LEPMJ|nr:hypothetical protein LEMA_P013960.1 [Plenodomus lingam JN3]KAH9859419.1 hypothetical protein IAQ61_011200 [Plenodomus lingam]CBY00266.1 hypothetical protein LEMA_P013960.1 [Plenodomus lingam JN3]